MFLCAWACVCVRSCVCVCARALVCVCMCALLYVYVCARALVCVCMCALLRECTQTHTQRASARHRERESSVPPDTRTQLGSRREFSRRERRASEWSRVRCFVVNIAANERPGERWCLPVPCLDVYACMCV